MDNPRHCLEMHAQQFHLVLHEYNYIQTSWTQSNRDISYTVFSRLVVTHSALFQSSTHTIHRSNSSLNYRSGNIVKPTAAKAVYS